jgi:hypothetical protein
VRGREQAGWVEDVLNKYPKGEARPTRFDGRGETDPFLPLEDYYHNTEAARAFVEVGLPIFFLSRLRYPDWAVELLTKSPGA